MPIDETSMPSRRGPDVILFQAFHQGPQSRDRYTLFYYKHEPNRTLRIPQFTFSST
jgi:hypothetical protein